MSSINTFKFSGVCSDPEEELVTPAQSVVFLGLNLNSITYWATLSEQKRGSLWNCVNQFRLGKTVSF